VGASPTGRRSNATAEQVIGYDIASCDNGVLLSGGFQTGDIPVASPVTHFSSTR
jgi:hypothetical protein